MRKDFSDTDSLTGGFNTAQAIKFSFIRSSVEATESSIGFNGLFKDLLADSLVSMAHPFISIAKSVASMCRSLASMVGSLASITHSLASMAGRKTYRRIKTVQWLIQWLQWIAETNEKTLKFNFYII